MNLILIGPPGSGKGTMGNLISENYKIPTYSTGEILREEIKKKTELGLLAEKLINKGNLVPDDVILKVVQNVISESKDGYILDGFPRTLEQAILLDEYLESKNDKIDAVLSFIVPDDVVIKRLSGRLVCSQCNGTYNLRHHNVEDMICPNCLGELKRREDDTPEYIQRRLDIFHETTFPVVDYYKSKYITFDIDSNSSIEDQYKRIDTLLQHLSKIVKEEKTLRD